MTRGRSERPQGRRIVRSTSPREICAGYTDEQPETIADFLARAVEAGRASSDEL